MQENTNQFNLGHSYELVAPPRRSGRYGPAKGSKKKEEDDDGGQTRCVCNQQRTYPLHPFPFSLQSTTPLFFTPTVLPFTSFACQLTPLLLLTSLSNDVSVHSSWNNDTLVCLLDVVVAIFYSCSRGNGAGEQERGTEERERTKKKENKSVSTIDN